MINKYASLLLALIFGLLLAPTHALAEKTDVVILVNGNAVTGEVKSLDFGSLRYSTDSMGTVSIDWEDIVNVTSKQALQIELADGTRYFGQLAATVDGHTVRVVTASQDLVIESNRIVRITPIDSGDRFIDRLDGEFTFGFQTQKSSEVTTSNFSADVSRRRLHDLYGMRLNSTLTDQPSEPTTVRQNANFNYQRFRGDRWFTDWTLGWERNDELGTAGRYSLGGSLGRYVVQTNKSQFSLATGLQGTRTKFTGDDDDTTQAEGRIEIRYLRRNLAPETSFRFTATIFPLIEDLATYRAESDLSLQREIIEDLFFEVGIGLSYASDPPEGSANSDYTVTTSLGYSF